MKAPKIVLASSSKYRAELLGRLGLEFEARSHRCDEGELKAKDLAPRELAARLAELKARSLAESSPGALIIGSDQVAELDGELMGKPGDEARAEAQLRRLRGKVHRLYTAVALVKGGGEGELLDIAVDVHEMEVRGDLTDKEISAYVARDRPIDCAGSYKIESMGIGLFESVSGQDFTAIVGLPMMLVVSMLRKAGVSIFS